MMKIFISWSGELSQAVAIILRGWLQSVIQVVEPYVSSEDIEKGSRWFTDIDKKLDESEFGIVCLSRENMNKPWILFEAGAISRTINRSRVTPLLIDLSPTDLSGPLAQFQATTITIIDMLKLVKDIGSYLGDSRFNDALIERSFNKWWPDFQRAVTAAIDADKKNEPRVAKRPDREILEEVLQTTRTLAQLISTTSSEIDVSRVPSHSEPDLERIRRELEKKRKMFVVVALEGASRTAIEGDDLYVEYAPEDKHLRDTLAKTDNIRALREACRKVLGRDIGIRIVVRDTNGNARQSGSLLKEERRDRQRLIEEVRRDPVVQRMLRAFGAEILDVQRVQKEQSKEDQNLDPEQQIVDSNPK